MHICLTTHTPTNDSGGEAGVGESPFGGHSNSPLGPSLQSPGDTISEEEARMVVALTEYFQEQRRLYEQVCYLCAVCVVFCICLCMCFFCVCLCVCIYVCTHLHVCMHMYVCNYVCTYMYINHICVFVDSCTNVCKTHKHIGSCKFRFMCIREDLISNKMKDTLRPWQPMS